MRRGLLATLIATFVVGLGVGAGTAFAAAPNRTTLALSCDRGVDQAIVSVWVQQDGHYDTGSFELSCGPNSVSGSKSDRTTQNTPFLATGVRVASFYVVTAQGVKDCSGATSALSAKITCADDNGDGATLTAR
jgi:hypothetical protein